MASFRKRDNKWQVQIRVAGMKPYSKTFSTKKAGQIWAREQETLIEGNNFKKCDTGVSTYVAHAIDRWVDEIVPTYDESGYGSYIYRAELMREHFGRYYLHKLDSDTIVKYALTRLDEGMAADTVRKELQVLEFVYKACDSIWKYRVPVNPVKEANIIIMQKRLLDPGEKRDRRLEDGELIRLLSVMHVNPTLIDYAVLFALETGLRRGELASLMRIDILKKRKIVKVRKTKTDWKTGKVGREVPLSKTALDIIDCLPKTTGRLFNLKPDSITTGFDRLCIKAGIEDLRLHDLRHETISRWFEMGFRIDEVASMSGHRSWASLKRYTHHKAEKLAARLG